MSTPREQIKNALKTSRRPITKAHNATERGQNHVRKCKVTAHSYMTVQNNLGQLVAKMAIPGRVEKYESIAKDLSSLVGLENGRVWGWRYVASVHSGSITPSKKFACAVALYLEHINPRQKQWFYFSRRHSVAAIYEKTILGEIIRTHLNGMGYKAIPHSRYVEIKRLATKKHTARKPA